VVISSDDTVIARVPDNASSGPIVITARGEHSNPQPLHVGVLITDNMHPVASPAVDREGNIYTTVSGSRGQKVPVSVYKIDTDYSVKPFLSDVMNATSLAFNHEGELFVSSRYEGAVYRVAPNGTMKTFAESMGVATGIVFDGGGNLYVGDRSGTIFKLSRSGETFVFATLEPSVSAYHLAIGPDGGVYVAGPTTSSFDSVYRIDQSGEVTIFYRGLGRPQGLAFDNEGNLWVAASLAGKRGIVKITPKKSASLAIAGNNIIGLAFTTGRAAFLTTTTSLYYLQLGVEGAPLFG
jgi:sugar lactone lactonase YvrE